MIIDVPSGYVNSLLLKMTIEIVDFPMKNGDFLLNMIYPLVMSQFAIENDHRNFVDFPIKNGGSFHNKM